MTSLSERVERKIARAIETDLLVEDDGRTLVVSGMVDTPEARASALEIAKAEAGSRDVDDAIEVTTVLPSETAGAELSTVEAGDLRGAEPGLADTGEAIEAGDFTDRSTLHSPQEAAGPGSSLEYDRTSEGGAAYTPPIDPVGGNREVIGGLQHSSMESIEVERSALDDQPGDEALRDAIIRELHEDSATTGLHLEVVVNRKVAHIRGHVPFLEDAENAEEVAARVPGLIEVIDDTEVDEFSR